MPLKRLYVHIFPVWAVVRLQVVTSSFFPFSSSGNELSFRGLRVAWAGPVRSPAHSSHLAAVVHPHRPVMEGHRSFSFLFRRRVSSPPFS